MQGHFMSERLSPQSKKKSGVEGRPKKITMMKDGELRNRQWQVME
jgi:hypothetical protein